MPSLRRSFSSPSVRSSPYLPSATTRPRPAPRRSSGSATTERRVLADIEWWRVCDGQCDLDLQDNPQLDPHPLDALGSTVTLSAGGSSLEPLSLHTFALDSMQSVFPDVLSIAPYSPNGRHGRDSSVESTPELSTAPLETVQFSPADPVPPFGDRFLFPSDLTRVAGRQPHPLFGSRSISAPGLSHREAFGPDFADLGGDSFSLDQNLFQ